LLDRNHGVNALHYTYLFLLVMWFKDILVCFFQNRVGPFSRISTALLLIIHVGSYATTDM